MKIRLIIQTVIAPSVAYAVAMVAANHYSSTYGFALVVVCATFLFGIGQISISFRPTLSLHRRHRETLVLTLLKSLASDLAGIVPNVQTQKLRFNIMELPAPFLCKKHLRITMDSGGYTIAERELKWPKGIGACGTAWRDKQQAICYADDYVHQGIGAQRAEICRHVKSVLSTPIKLPNGKIVGVLNIDSQHKNSCIGNKMVQDTLLIYADMIATLY